MNRHELINELGDLGFVGVADDPGNARKGSKLFGSALSVAAGDDDAGAGIGGVELANGVAGLGVGGGGDRTSIDHDDVGVRGFARRSKAAFEELALEGGAISLSGAAAELFDVKGGHFGRNLHAMNRRSY